MTLTYTAPVKYVQGTDTTETDPCVLEYLRNDTEHEASNSGTVHVYAALKGVWIHTHTYVCTQPADATAAHGNPLVLHIQTQIRLPYSPIQEKRPHARALLITQFLFNYAYSFYIPVWTLSGNCE